MKLALLSMIFCLQVVAAEKGPLIPEQVLKLHTKACPDFAEERGAHFSREVFVLPGKSKETFYLLGCELYAYNSMERGYIVNQEGEIRDVVVPEVNAKGEISATKDLMGSGHDEATGSLYTYSKGRGMGDCGSTASYQYEPEDKVFYLKEARVKEECDEDTQSDWPVVYPKKEQ